MNECNHFIAYSDGSGDNLNPHKPGGLAYIILDSDGKVIKRESEGYIGVTNNQMELLAIVHIIESLPPNSSVTIHTDSQYCILAINSKKPKKNLEILAMYHKSVSELHLKVSFEWVKGHSGNKYNEECDRMANEEYRRKLQEYEHSTVTQQSAIERQSKGNSTVLVEHKLDKAKQLAQRVKVLANSLEVQARDYDVKWPLKTIQALKAVADDFLKLR